MKTLNTLYNRVRIAATGAPILIFLYGVLRFLAVTDANQSHGFAWNVGHTLFAIAFVLFAGLVVELRQLVPVRNNLTQIGSYAAMVCGLIGAAFFLWGILGDLFVSLHDAAPVPGPLQVVGPLLFQVGVLGLLVMLVTTRPRRLPIWSPPLVLVGFLLFAISLDLIPVGAAIILLGLSPLIRRSSVA